MNGLGSAEGIPYPAPHTSPSSVAAQSHPVCSSAQLNQPGKKKSSPGSCSSAETLGIWEDLGWPCAVPITPRAEQCPSCVFHPLATVSTLSSQGLFATRLSEIVPDHLLDIKYSHPVPQPLKMPLRCNSTRLLHSLLLFLFRVIQAQI